MLPLTGLILHETSNIIHGSETNYNMATVTPMSGAPNIERLPDDYP